MAGKTAKRGDIKAAGNQAGARSSPSKLLKSNTKISSKPTGKTPAPKPAVKSAPVPAPSRQPQPAKASVRSVRQPNGGLKVAVAGCAGRMGRMLLKLLIQAPGVLVVGGSERKGSPALGTDLGALAGAEPLGVSVSDDPAALFDHADVVVDFTSPAASASHAGLAARTGTGHVIGTTGLDADQMAAIARAATKAPIVMASNMSLGINLMEQMIEQIARILDPDWDIEIIEMHHRHKVDAPSGTALMLGEAAARGRGQTLRRLSRRTRDGHIGPRAKGEIGFAVLRGGDVVGDHTVIFAADGERVEISHKASSREVLAHGAIRAMLWVAGRKPGLYSMKDVLGLSISGPGSTVT